MNGFAEDVIVTKRSLVNHHRPPCAPLQQHWRHEHRWHGRGGGYRGSGYSDVVVVPGYCATPPGLYWHHCTTTVLHWAYTGPTPGTHWPPPGTHCPTPETTKIMKFHEFLGKSIKISKYSWISRKIAQNQQNSQDTVTLKRRSVTKKTAKRGWFWEVCLKSVKIVTILRHSDISETFLTNSR